MKWQVGETNRHQHNLQTRLSNIQKKITLTQREREKERKREREKERKREREKERKRERDREREQKE